MKGLLAACLLMLSCRLSADALMEANSLYKVALYSEAATSYLTIASDAAQPADVRALAWQGAGNCAMQLRDKGRAKEAYDQALSLNPANTALAAYVAKIWPPEAAPENGVGAHGSAPAPEAAAAVKGGGPDTWMSAGLKSLVLPGWAQYSRGETAKGEALGVLSFGAWILYAWASNDAAAKTGKYETYAAEAASLKAAGKNYDPYRPDGAYREANAAQLASTVALGALITVYGGTFWDAVRGTPEVKQSLFSVEPRGDGIEVAYARRF